MKNEIYAEEFISRLEEAANDYSENIGKEQENSSIEPLSSEQFTPAVECINTAPKYASCKLEANSTLLYLELDLTINVISVNHYLGKAYGISGLGNNTAWGDLFTDDYFKLTQNTARFIFTISPGYCTAYFYDKESDLLGHAQFEGFESSSGMGGGTGKWL